MGLLKAEQVNDDDNKALLREELRQDQRRGEGVGSSDRWVPGYVVELRGTVV